VTEGERGFVAALASASAFMSALLSFQDKFMARRLYLFCDSGITGVTDRRQLGINLHIENHVASFQK